MPQLLNPAIFVLRPSTQLISYYSQFSKIYCIFTPAFSRTWALVGWCGVVSFINNDSTIQCSRHFRAKLFSRYFLAWPERSDVQTIIRPGLLSYNFWLTVPVVVLRVQLCLHTRDSWKTLRKECTGKHISNFCNTLYIPWVIRSLSPKFYTLHMTRQVPSNTKSSFHIYRGPENETNPNFVSLDIILNRIFLCSIKWLHSCNNGTKFCTIRHIFQIIAMAATHCHNSGSYNKYTCLSL